MSRGAGVPLADRTRRNIPAASRQTAEDERGRHCWVVDSPGHPGRYPGVLVEWRRRGQAWDGLVAYVMPELHGGGSRLVERWVEAQYLEPIT